MCTDNHDGETASLLDGIAGTVFVAGDNAYDNGTLTEYNNCYNPTWGRHKGRTRPVPGNHEYNTSGAAGYYSYFGAAAGEAGKGYYSYDLDAWHIIALNNYVSMNPGSPQLTWLQADLAATTKPCRLAYWHEPLCSSTTGAGSGGVMTNSVKPLFTALYNAGVDVVLNGHRHFYERMAPMNPEGALDTTRGIREIIVGTGGAGIGDPTNAYPRSEVRFGSNTYGVLKLYLYDGSYAWRFIPVPGRTLTDTGSYACHTAAVGPSPSLSTVEATPTAIQPGGSSTIVVEVKDAAGRPLSGVAVHLAVSPGGAGVTLTQPVAVTGANGDATGTLSATAVGNQTVSASGTLGGTTTAFDQTATVSVAPPAVVAQTLLTAGNNPVNQRIYTTASISPAANALVTVAVLGRVASGSSPSPTLSGGGMAAWTEVASVAFDPISAPLRRLTVFRAMSSAPGSGPLTITFAGTQSNAQWIVSQWTGVELSGVNGAGAILQSGTLPRDAVNGVTVTLPPFAHVNNVSYGAFGLNRTVVSIAPGSGFTEISEQASGESTPGDLQTEWRQSDNTIDATWPAGLNGAGIGLEIKSASSGGSGVDALQSGVEVAPTTITAGGTGATITVTVRDGTGTALSGAAVSLSATGTGNTLTPTTATSDANGVVSATLSSTIAETKTISAIANGTTLSEHPALTVTAGPISAARSSVAAAPATIGPGGQTSTITVSVKDAYDNPVNGASVVLSATPAGGVTLTQPSPTDASGTAIGALSSILSEDKVVSATATIGGVSTPITSTVTVTVSAQGASMISQTLLTSGNNAANLKVYSTASVAPAPNTLVTVAVLGRAATGASASPTLSGGGMAAWTEVASTTFDPIGTPTRRLTVFRAMSTAPGSGPLTITFPATQSNAQWIVSQWSGVNTTGGNGAGAIAQSGALGRDAVTGLTVTLPSFENVNDVAYGAFGVNRSTAGITPGTGFTEISEWASGETSPGDLQTEWRANDNTIDASWAQNLNGGGVGLEIRAGPGAGPTADGSLSTMEAEPPSITPGGAGAAILVTVRDAGGNPIGGATVELTATPVTGNTLIQPGSVTDVNGLASGTLSSTKAELKTISATVRLGTTTTPLTRTVTVLVNVGPPSAGQSTVQASPATIGVGGPTATITVTVKDDYGNLVSGASVQLSASGSGNTLSAAGTTNGSGVYTGTISSTVSGDKTVTATVGGTGGTVITQTALVTVTAGSVDPDLSTVEAAPLSIDQGSDVSTITVTAKDALGNPAAGVTVVLSVPGSGATLTQPTSATNALGVATGTLSAASWGARTVSATAGGTAINQTATVTVHQVVSTSLSTVAVAPGAIEAGSGSATITVTVNDTHGDPISGAAVAVSATGSGNTLPAAGTTNGSGVYTGTFSSTVAEQKTLSATANTAAIAQTPTLQVTESGSVSGVNSSLTLSPGSIEAGTGTTTITVTAKDALDRPVAGASVVLAATGTGNTLSAPGLTDGSGVYTGTLSSTVVEGKTISASANGTSVVQTAGVTVTPGPVDAGHSSVGVTPAAITQGTELSTIAVTAKDAFDNPVPGVTVTLAATGDGNTLSQPVAATNAAGQASGSLSATAAGDHVVSASAGGTAITQTATVAVQQVFSPAQSSVSASPTIAAGGSAATVTVTVRDTHGDPIGGATVTLQATGTGNTLAAPGLTDASGGYTGSLSSTVAESKTVSASVSGTSITQTAAVTVTAGDVSAGQSTVAAAPASIIANSGSTTITVTVKDAYGNPIGGAAVALSGSGSGNSFTQPGSTGVNGVTTGALSSSVAESKIIAASATVLGVTTALTQTATVTVTAQIAVITHTLLTDGNNQTNQKVFTTAAIAPAPNTFITLAVMGHNSSAALPSPVVTGGGMTAWTEVGSVTFDAGATPHKRITLYRAMSASPGSGPITITFSSSVSNAQWSVSQWDGADAIVQVGSTQADGVNGLTVPLATFGHANNVAYGVFGAKSSTAAVTPGTGFTEITEQPSLESPPGSLQTERAVNINSVAATWVNLSGAALAVEIRARAL